MMERSDDEVYRLRKKAIDYLKGPTRRKARGVLDNGHGARCCLGHICQALKKELGVKVHMGPFGVLYDELRTALPDKVRRALGFLFRDGTFVDEVGATMFVDFSEKRFSSLAGLNDLSMTSPQEIGAWLEKNILGGPGTPWKKIDPSEEAMRDE